MKCQDRNRPEWIRMESELGEEEATALFIANNYSLPSMEQIDDYINKSQKEFYQAIETENVKSREVRKVLPFNKNQELYKEYNLVNNQGERKSLPNDLKTKEWIFKLNLRHPEYTFEGAYSTLDGNYKITMHKNLKVAEWRFDQEAVEIQKLLQAKLHEVYPAIKVKFDNWNKFSGKANIQAMEVLIDALYSKKDTLPHEYAHHYIAWFRNTSIVKRALEYYKTEEALVQAIGEQAVKQKGRAFNWWKQFMDWILDYFGQQEILEVLTDSFLEGRNLITGDKISLEESLELARKAGDTVHYQQIDESIPESENKTRKALENVIYDLSLQVAEYKKKDIAKLKTQQAEQINKKIATLKSNLEGATYLNGIYQYIDYVYDMSKLAQNEMKGLIETINKQNQEKIPFKKQLVRMSEIHNYIQSFKTLAELEEFIDNKNEDYEGKRNELLEQYKNGEITKEEFNEKEKYLAEKQVGSLDKLSKAIAIRNMIYKDYIQYGLPYMAKFLYEAIDWTKSNQTWLDVANLIKRGNRKPEQYARKHNKYEYEMRKAKENNISEDDKKILINRLAIEYIQGNIMTEEAILRLLKENPKDIGWIQANLTETIGVSDPIVALFSKNTLDALEHARLSSLNTKEELGQSYHKYELATQISPSDVKLFNDPFIEEVEDMEWDSDKKEYVVKKRLYFARNRNYEAYHKNYIAFRKKLNEKYQKYLPVFHEINELKRDLYEQGRNKDEIKVIIWEQEEYHSIKKQYNEYYEERSRFLKENTEVRTDFKVYEDGMMIDLVTDGKQTAVEKYIEWKERQFIKKMGVDGKHTTFSERKFKDWKSENIQSYYNQHTDETVITYRGELIQPKKSLYPSQKWGKLQANAAAKEYYDSLLNQYLVDQEKIPIDERRGYIIPTVEKDVKDRAKDTGKISAIKREVKGAVTMLETQDQYALNDLKSETEGKEIPIYYTNDVEIDNVSRDLLGSVLLFNKMANRFQAKNELMAEANLMLDILDLRELKETTTTGKNIIGAISQKLNNPKFLNKSKGTVDNSTELFRGFLDMIFFGENEKKIDFEFGGKEFSLNKITGTTAMITSATTLVGNVMAGINNVLLGNVMNFVEAHAKSSFSASDYRKGLNHYATKVIPAWTKDFNKVGGLSKETMLIEAFDMIQGHFDDQFGRNITGSTAKKLLRTSSLFFINNAAEHQIQCSSGFAHLFSFKCKNSKGEFIDKNGKPTTEANAMNLYDALSVKDGKLSLNEHVANFDMKEDIVKLSNKIRRINERMHGIYNNFDKSQLQRTVLGKMVFLFRKWIVPGFKRRFQSLRIDVAEEDLYVGNYRQFWDILSKETNQFFKYITLKENDLADFEKQAIKKTLTELSYMGVAFIIFSIMSGIKGDDDDNWMTDMTAYQSRRLVSELGFFAPPFAFFEAGKILQSPSASMTSIERVYKLGRQVFMPFEEFERKSGMWEKGDYKIQKRFMDVFPILSQIERSTNPEIGVRQFSDDYAKDKNQ